MLLRRSSCFSNTIRVNESQDRHQMLLLPKTLFGVINSSVNPHWHNHLVSSRLDMWLISYLLSERSNATSLLLSILGLSHWPKQVGFQFLNLKYVLETKLGKVKLDRMIVRRRLILLVLSHLESLSDILSQIAIHYYTIIFFNF